MGFVDRGGGREAKGASLRRSKKNPGASAARKAYLPKPQTAARVLPTQPTFSIDRPYVDAGVALLARKLDVDRDMLMRRAGQQGGVAAALTWCGDFERQEALVEHCKQHNAVSAEADGSGGGDGILYSLVGVHVNNVDRTHKKVQQSWVDSVVSLARHPEVVGLLSGLNLGRDSATHFAQEWLLQNLWDAAGTLQMPLVLHIYHNTHMADGTDGEKDGVTDKNLTVDRAAELLTELINRKGEEEEEEIHGGTRRAPTAIVLYNGVGVLACSPAMRALVRRYAPSPAAATHAACLVENAPPIYVLATAEGLLKEDGSPLSPSSPAVVSGSDDGADYTKSGTLSFSSVLSDHIALSQLLIGTDSPWNTPQNIPDAYTRTMPNEPANYCYVVNAIHSAMRFGLSEPSVDLQQLHTVVRDNFVRLFFGLAESTFTSTPSVSQQQQNGEKDNDNADGTEAPGQKCAEPGQVTQAVHFDPSVMTSSDVVQASPDATSYYLCLKCRRRLFHKNSILTHLPDRAQKHFTDRHRGALKANKRSLVVASCESVYFLRVIEETSGEWVVDGSCITVCRMNGTVSCCGCNTKLGTAGEDVCCPCGCPVSGRTVRVAASKVEEPVGLRSGGDLDELLLQAAREREQMQQAALEAALCGDRDDGDDGGEKKKREPKKNVKSNNRSNFTHFRNKNFVPRRQLRGDADVKNGEEDNDDVEYEQTEETSSMQRECGRKNRRRSTRRMNDEIPSKMPGSGS